MAAQLPTTLLQLSDLHFATTDFEKPSVFGDRIGDADLFAAALLPGLAPDAVLITGDLTEGKLATGGGAQQPGEWRAYGEFLAAVRSAMAPKPAVVMDVRGNHDTFDVGFRGGPGDFYPGVGALATEDVGARVAVRALGGTGPSNSTCPAATLVALDFAPELGLRSPSNFAGVVPAGFLTELESAAAAWNASAQLCADRPLVISLGHYPISTVTFSERRPWPLGRLAALLAPLRQPGPLLRRLMDLGVDAYLSGHLHAAFGQRLHALHAMPGSTRRFADLESTAWKDDRRFRLLAVDHGQLTFVDLFFHTPRSPAQVRRVDFAARSDSGT